LVVEADAAMDPGLAVRLDQPKRPYRPASAVGDVREALEVGARIRADRLAGVVGVGPPADEADGRRDAIAQLRGELEDVLEDPLELLGDSDHHAAALVLAQDRESLLEAEAVVDRAGERVDFLLGAD